MRSRVARALLTAITAALFGLGLVIACRRGPPAPESIVLSVPYEPDTLDPHAKDRLSNAAIASHFYEPLVTADSEMGIHPGLALRWNNPDLLTWIFNLRSDVKFHDGRPFGAADVVHTFERLLSDKELECGLYAVQITSVKALQPLTVEIRTRRPMGVLLNKISKILIVPKGAGQELARHVNGTGPYRLESWSGDTIRMSRFDSYWGRAPALARVTFLLARAPETAMRELTQGTSQFAQCASRETAAALGANPDIHIVRRTGLFLKYLAFDVAHDISPFVSVRPNPFRKGAVRQAISLAIDRKALTARLSSFAVPASQFVPPFIFGFDPTLPELPTDVAKARTLLQQAGLKDGMDVTLHTRKIIAETARIVAETLSPLGIRATVVELSDSEFLERGRRHELSFFLNRFGCASGDISDVLDAGFHTPDASRRLGTANHPGFSDPELDAMIEKSAEILEATDRRNTLEEAVHRIMNEAVWIPLYFDEDAYALRKSFTWQPRANSYILAQEIATSRKTERS